MPVGNLALACEERVMSSYPTLNNNNNQNLLFFIEWTDR